MGLKRLTEEFVRNYLCTIDDFDELFSVDNWIEFSIKNRTEKEIELYSLINEYFLKGKADREGGCICYSYICRYSTLSEDFIKELMFITSGLFDFKYWDDYHVNIVIEMIIACNDKNIDFQDYVHNLVETEKDRLHPIFKSKLSVRNPYHNYKSEYIKSISDKLSWFEIFKYQDLSKEFSDKFSCLLTCTEYSRIYIE